MRRVLRRDGYTLAETIISFALFVSVTAFVSGVFVRAVRTQRVVNGEIAVNNSINFVLEQIVRDVRSGHDFRMEASGSRLFFTDRNELGAVYRLDNGAIWRNVSGAADVKLTSANVNVQSLFFTVMQSGCDPWRVTVRMGVRSRQFFNPDPVFVQTTVSSRVLPVDVDVDNNGDGDDDYQECEDIVYGSG